MSELIDRIEIHDAVSSELGSLSDEALLSLLDKGKDLHAGIGGKSKLISVLNKPIFTKKVPLSKFELLKENYRSTANIFDLPMCFQYGIGSQGFGAWRELASHEITTDWVLSGACPNFPIMYYWRILQREEPPLSDNEKKKLVEKHVQYWENSPSVRRRVDAVYSATDDIYIFMEYIPDTLFPWLESKLDSTNSAINAIEMVSNQLKNTTLFMREHGFLHMDAHFDNILTDGEQLYFSDFGLGLSDKFRLSEIESQFFKDNKGYDKYSTLVNLLHRIITHYFGKKDWEVTLKDYINNVKKPLPDPIDKLIKEYANVAFIMDTFYQEIQKDKSTTFPNDELERCRVG